MIPKISVGIVTLLLGIFAGYCIFSAHISQTSILRGIFSKKEVIGFLPYWQTTKAHLDYSPYITTLSYFGLALDSDGTILKLTTPQQREPGWNALVSGRVAPFLASAKKNHVSLSLVIFSGNTTAIDTVLDNPSLHAKNLVSEIEPLMQHNGFSDVNMDIEYTASASSAARLRFTQFIAAIKKQLIKDQTLTVEIMSTDVIKDTLIDTKAIGKIADHIVIMAYDYHSPDSYVTGPVAPVNGAGSISEYDVATAVKEAVRQIAPSKIILGVPLYGYEWETLQPDARAAIVPGSGVLASNNRAESLIASCATCSAAIDIPAQEMHISYKDGATNTYHQLFFPNTQSMRAKLDLADSLQLVGVALWALGYEGTSILKPLTSYKN